MKNMNPSEMKEMLSQAKEAQKMMEEQIRRIIDEEIEKRELISKRELEELVAKILNPKS